MKTNRNSKRLTHQPGPEAHWTKLVLRHGHASVDSVSRRREQHRGGDTARLQLEPGESQVLPHTGQDDYTIVTADERVVLSNGACLEDVADGGVRITDPAGESFLLRNAEVDFDEKTVTPSLRFTVVRPGLRMLWEQTLRPDGGFTLKKESDSLLHCQALEVAAELNFVAFSDKDVRGSARDAHGKELTVKPKLTQQILSVQFIDSEKTVGHTEIVRPPINPEWLLNS